MNEDTLHNYYVVLRVVLCTSKVGGRGRQACQDSKEAFATRVCAYLHATILRFTFVPIERV
jgi:hypothetical protein